MPPKKKGNKTPEIDELRQQLKTFDSEKIKEKRERKVARLAERKKYLEAMNRANHRLEYDRLVGEIPSIARIARNPALGELVAERVASTLYKRLADLKGMYKQSTQGTKHEIEK